MAAAGSAATWQLVDATPMYRCYSYKNAALHDSLQKSCLWVCIENRMVNFLSNGSESGWHGSFEEDNIRSMITLRFNCKGDQGRLKPTIVMKVGDGQYSGFDYAGREITMTYAGEFKWRDDTQTWTRA